MTGRARFLRARRQSHQSGLFWRRAPTVMPATPAAPDVVSALGIAAIKAHFSNAGLVPALLETFEPQGTLTLNFDGRRDA